VRRSSAPARRGPAPRARTPKPPGRGPCGSLTMRAAPYSRRDDPSPQGPDAELPAVATRQAHAPRHCDGRTRCAGRASPPPRRLPVSTKAGNAGLLP
jgi:hypothetical protein